MRVWGGLEMGSKMTYVSLACRAVPLRPLLEMASLRIFSELIMDVPTAAELLNADERQKGTTT
jgi:hypothetical protein